MFGFYFDSDRQNMAEVSAAVEAAALVVVPVAALAAVRPCYGLVSAYSAG